VVSLRCFEYWALNLYDSIDAVYAVSYAILLLNTDLHVADISKHMSRQEFIDNTLSTITGTVIDHESNQSILLNSRSSAKLSLYNVFGAGGDLSKSSDAQKDAHPWSHSAHSLKLPNHSVSTLHSSTNPSPTLPTTSSFSPVDQSNTSSMDPIVPSHFNESEIVALLKVR
jgi:hypothetical protein